MEAVDQVRRKEIIEKGTEHKQLIKHTRYICFKIRNRSQGCKVRCASNHQIVGVYRLPQMQGVGRADVLLYFKCPTTKQMRCPVNAY